jgi:hypothetical protein
MPALDPADYSPVTINKSISITGVEGAGIDTNGGNAITVNPPPGTPTINLDKLVIQNVSGSGTAGTRIFAPLILLLPFGESGVFLWLGGRLPSKKASTG